MKYKRLIFLLIVFSFISIIPLLHKGFYLSDDGEWMIIRFSAFHQALVSGQFPVRFLPRLYQGYGYPVANFLYPGFMYMAEIPRLLKISFADSIKIVLFFSMISSSIFTFLWLSKRFDKIAAFFGSLIFLYTPYHLFDIYKRGSVGEILSFAILPFVMWNIERGDIFWMSVGISMLLIAHNTQAIIFGTIIGLYLVMKFLDNRNKKMFYKYICAIIFGFGISSFFWLPAIGDLKYTNFSNIQVSDYRDYFVSLDLIGISTVLIFITSLLIKIKNKSNLRYSILFLLLGVSSVFLSLSISSPIWKILPSNIIQFPFRLLSIAAVASAFLFSEILNVLNTRNKYILGIIVLFVALISSRRYLGPSQYVDRQEGYYSTNQDSTTVQNEYLPKWVDVRPQIESVNKVDVTSGNLSLTKANGSKFMFSVDSDKASDVTVHTFYFPGWGAIVDGKRENLSIDKYGQMHVSLTKGVHFITVYFSETPFRAFADVLSLATLMTLVIFKLKYKDAAKT